MSNLATRYFYCLVFYARFQQFVQLYQGVSWVSYQYYWSIYPDISQSVVMLTSES